MKRTSYRNTAIALLVATMGIVMTGVAMFGISKVNAADSDYQKIIPYTRENGSGTRGAFASLTGLEGRDYFGELEDMTSEDVAVLGSSGEMVMQVSNTSDGLGYVSYAYLKEESGVKTLQVNDVTLTDENIKNDSYPLIRPFQLVYHGKMNDVQADFLRFIKSEGQGDIEDYCVPVRGEGIYLKSGAEGKLTISGSTSMTPMMRKLVKTYKKANPKVEVRVVSSDSEAGMMDVLQGDSAFAMVSRNLKQYEAEVFSSEVIGKDAIAVIVHPENEVSDISTAQLKKIYEKSLVSWEYLNVYQ